MADMILRSSCSWADPRQNIIVIHQNIGIPHHEAK